MFSTMLCFFHLITEDKFNKMLTAIKYYCLYLLVYASKNIKNANNLLCLIASMLI